jgi:hypothetical protein
MTQRSVQYLKTRFETADIPTQSDYQDLFDSFMSLEASAAQVLNGPIEAPQVSAGVIKAGLKTIHSSQTVTQNERAIILSPLEPGRRQIVMNSGTTALLVFPPSGQNFVGSAANGAISIPTLTGCEIPHYASAYGFIR